MKVELSTHELKTAVEHYLNSMMYAGATIDNLKVVVGRGSNDTRVEFDLQIGNVSLTPTKDYGANCCGTATCGEAKSEPVEDFDGLLEPVKQEAAEESVQEEPKAETAAPLTDEIKPVPGSFFASK